ncbi:MAG TPA: glutamate-5-semialdehyde dehydrogenase [bacterium]|nr:glutamate-5-semialdehyde dehydrogenase [bacterium]
MAKETADVLKKAKAARAAALDLAMLRDAKKRAALRAMAAALRKNRAKILKANAIDVGAAERQVKAGKMSKAMLKRLMVDASKVEEMARGVESVAKLSDPTGIVLSAMEMDRGLVLEQISCPIGVIGAIFESRPDVVPQVSSLCLKSGNAVILKGGSEAANSNKILVDILTSAAESVGGFPKRAIQLIETREEVRQVLELDEYIDLLVPRGSNDFVRFIKDNTRIPVLGHADGICHVYIDAGADLGMAVKIALEAKIQYPAACNAAETLLVHEKVAASFLPAAAAEYAKHGVEMRGCPKTKKIVKGIKAASEADWGTEYLDLVISIRVVKDIDEAIRHINKYGSKHTDTIVTSSKTAAKKFFDSVDSACVFHNASTRFSDGFRFGKGAEIGISTNKTHARGPVGLEGLVIYKYLIKGSGQTVAEYSGPKAKKYTHKKLK